MCKNVDKRVRETLYSGYIGQGSRVKIFESMLSKELSARNVLALNSCTSALHLALYLVTHDEKGIPLFDDGHVLLSPFSCFATTSSVIASPLKPRWVDVDSWCNIDLQDLESKLNADTKAIVIVHFAGKTVDTGRLKQILDVHEKKYKFRPYVIEDCAQAFGSLLKTGISPAANAGELRSICCYSFQAVKFLTTVDGGAIVCPDDNMHDRAKKLRWYGLDRDVPLEKQNIQEAGFKYHMNDFNATVGIANFNFIKNSGLLEKQRERCRKFDAIFNNELNEYCGLQLPVFVADRDAFISHLGLYNIESSPAHYRCDRHDCVSDYFDSNLPGVDTVEKHMTLIPAGWWVDEKDWEYIWSRVSNTTNWAEEGF